MGFYWRIESGTHLVFVHANFLDGAVQGSRLGMVHTIKARSVVDGVNAVGGLMNRDRGLRLVLVGVKT